MSSTNTDLEDRDGAATSDESAAGVPADGVAGRTGLDGVALKPTECDVRAAAALPFGLVCVDYEGRESFPAFDWLAELARDRAVRVATPVRADGFDPRGDDSLARSLPDRVGRIVVAGHPAYLTDAERTRAIAPRLGDAVRAAADPWVGTEGVERVALAAGGTQYELLSRSTERDLRALRAAGYAGEIAVYAPTVPTDDEDAVLDAVGGYTARREPVRSALPDDAATDSGASGRAREVLRQATHDYALVGDPETVGERVAAIKEAGADLVIGYPAGGVDTFREA